MMAAILHFDTATYILLRTFSLPRCSHTPTWKSVSQLFGQLFSSRDRQSIFPIPFLPPQQGTINLEILSVINVINPQLPFGNFIKICPVIQDIL